MLPAQSIAATEVPAFTDGVYPEDKFAIERCLDILVVQQACSPDSQSG